MTGTGGLLIQANAGTGAAWDVARAELCPFGPNAEGEREANARLIAQAPATLAALRQTVFALEFVLMLQGANLPPAGYRELVRYVSAGKAAIREATGEGEE